VARHGYAADAPFIDTPRDARHHYSKRFGIESSYRLAKQSLALTSSRDAGLRLLLFVVSLVLQNSWRYLHWKYVAAPRRGGRHLWEWSFIEFCEMVLRAAWTVLGVRRSVPANQTLDERFFR
jgi:IS4 transposase